MKVSWDDSSQYIGKIIDILTLQWPTASRDDLTIRQVTIRWIIQLRAKTDTHTHTHLKSS